MGMSFLPLKLLMAMANYRIAVWKTWIRVPVSESIPASGIHSILFSGKLKNRVSRHGIVHGEKGGRVGTSSALP